MSILTKRDELSLEESFPPEPRSSQNDGRNDEFSARILNNSQRTTSFTVIFVLWLALTAMIWTFDSVYAGVVLVMPAFNRDFGTCKIASAVPGHPEEVCAISALQQSLNSLSYVFAGLGSITAGFVGTKAGRRVTLSLGGSLIVIAAAGMLGTSGNYTAYLACRCIGAIGIGQLYASSTVYGVEVVAPQKRGFLMALYSVGMSLGVVVATAVCYGSSHLKNSWEWKLPILLQIPLSLILVFGTWFFPESPRWLLLIGRQKDAQDSLARFFRKEPRSHEVMAQIQESKNYIELERGWQKNNSWTGIFAKTEIQRTLCSLLVTTGLAITGEPFIATYGTIFFRAVGINNPYVISFIIGLCGLAGTPVGPFIVEYGGRRMSLLIGYTIMAVCMLIFSAVNTGLKEHSQVGLHVVIAFICIWSFTFAAFVSSASWTSSTELHSIRLRAYGQAFSVCCNLILSFTMAFVTPYMLNPEHGNMGTNVGYFYFGLTVIVLGLVFLFIPETARISLEQIDDYFTSNKRAWTTSIQKNKRLQD